MEREYVIINLEHMSGGMLLFWGNYTSDDAKKRSFGGYTRNLEQCEKYTKEELLNSGYDFKFYKEGMKWRRETDFYIKINDLEKLGRKMTAIYI